MRTGRNYMTVIKEPSFTLYWPDGEQDDYLNIVCAYVNLIRDSKDDDEKAHCVEDELRELFIYWIASNEPLPNPVFIANTVLSTNDIHFSRWCA